MGRTSGHFYQRGLVYCLLFIINSAPQMALPIEGELSAGLRGAPLIVISLNCLIAVGTYRYNLDGYLKLLFEKADVVVELFGELVL